MAKNEVQPEVFVEAEISYEGNKDLIKAVRDFIKSKGIKWKRKREGTRPFPATYWDTKKFRLLAQKMELRAKASNKGFTHDLKVPLPKSEKCEILDPRVRQRYEIKARRQNKPRPRLQIFKHVTVLDQLWKNAPFLLSRKPNPKVIARFQSFVAPCTLKGGVVEYKIDIGYFEDPKDSRNRTPFYYLFEIEHVQGKSAALNEAIEEIDNAFGNKGLIQQARPKIIIGYDMLVSKGLLTKGQTKAYSQARKHFTSAEFPV